MESINIKFIPKEQQRSEYDWADIFFNELVVGKARCLIEGEKFTIFSINIYPDYQGKGYGKAFVENAKLHFKIIIADRVRFKAAGFWENVGFKQLGQTDNWIFDNRT